MLDCIGKTCMNSTTHLCILLLSLELKLNIEQQDLWIPVRFGLHLKAGIGEGLLESDSIYQEAVPQASSLDLLGADHLEVQRFSIQLGHRLNYHVRKELLFSTDLQQPQHGADQLEILCLSVMYASACIHPGASIQRMVACKNAGCSGNENLGQPYLASLALWDGSYDPAILSVFIIVSALQQSHEAITIDSSMLRFSNSFSGCGANMVLF